MTHVGYRLERHNAHMAAVRAVQRRNRLERVRCVLHQYTGWLHAGLLPGDGEDTIHQLRLLREDIEAEMVAEGQQP